VDVEASLRRAEQMLSVAQTADAAAAASMLVDAAPDDWRVHDLIARVAVQQAIESERVGLIEAWQAAMLEAVAHYRTAIGLAPSQAGLWRSAGDAAHVAGDIEQAAIWYEEALQRSPEDPRVLIRLAQIRFDSVPDVAMAHLRNAAKLAPQVAEVHASMALLHALNGRRPEALACIEQAVKLAGDEADVRIVEARVMRTLGEPSIGVEILLSLPAGSHRSEAATAELARCWMALGRPDRAAKAWTTCFQHLAHRTDAWRLALRAAEAHLEAGDHPAAATLLRQAEMLQAPQEAVAAVRAGVAAK